MTEVTAICRFCHATCAMVATLENGQITKLIGDIDNPMYSGYSCVKGRNYHAFHYSNQRILNPQRRSVEGSFEDVPAPQAFAEVASRLQSIIEKHGPRAVAMYGGTFSHFCPAGVMLREAFMDAIDSPMRFTNATIDQPSKPISMALHGRWGAGPQVFADAGVCLLVGTNPLVSMWGGIPSFNPAKRLHEAHLRGLKLIVIDPCRTETARKADLHLQCLPGYDAALLAAFINVICLEKLYDQAFVTAEAEGFADLRTAVAPFTPERVAAIAGVSAVDIMTAARLFAGAKRGNATSGTGASMAPHGVLMDYLVLALNTICGRWIKAGEVIPNRGVLFRQFSGVARAEKPRAAALSGESLRVRGLTETVAGLPTAALADEILQSGAGQVKALFVVGGNPMVSWPNQEKTRRALAALELLVVVDPMRSSTAQQAHYIFGPRLGFESPAITFGNEGITVYGLSLGYPEPYAQYQPKLIDPPAGSEVFEDWRIFYELGRHMNLPLAFRGKPFDMHNPPSTDELLALFVSRSRVPLDEIKKYPHGKIFPDPEPIVQSRAEDWPYRLQLAAPQMVAELARLDLEIQKENSLDVPSSPVTTGQKFIAIHEMSLLLITRREHAVYNSVGHDLPALQKRRPFNPAYLHPEDAVCLGVSKGTILQITSGHGVIHAVAQPSAEMRRGVVSLAHGFDVSLGDGRNARTSALIDDETNYEPLSGLPRMSAVPVTVRVA